MEQAYRSADRVVFTVHAEADGAFDATLSGSAETVLVNGRRSEAVDGAHSLTLRKGLNATNSNSIADTSSYPWPCACTSSPC